MSHEPGSLSKLLTCNICTFPFDYFDHRPKMLSCGHTVCLNCINNMMKTSGQNCPWCREDIKVIADNFMGLELLGILEKSYESESVASQQSPVSHEDSRKPRCVGHNKDYTKFCETCNQLVCDSCIDGSSLPSHGIGHTKIDLEVAYQQLKISEIRQAHKLRELAFQIKTVDINHMDHITNLILEKQESELKKIESNFKNDLEVISLIQAQVEASAHTNKALLSQNTTEQCEKISVAKSSLFQLYEYIITQVPDEAVNNMPKPFLNVQITSIQDSMLKYEMYKKMEFDFKYRLSAIYKQINGSSGENKIVVRISLPYLNEEENRLAFNYEAPLFDTKLYSVDTQKTPNPFGFGPGIKRRSDGRSFH